MFVEWSTEDHMCDAFRLHTLEWAQNGMYEWSLTESKSTTRSNPELNFRVFFAPKVHWLTISTQIVLSEEFTWSSCHSETKDIEITFEYRTRSCFSQQLGSHIEVQLSHLKLQLLHPDVTLYAFHHCEDHKLTLLLRVFRRDKTMTIRSVYVGRAQEIQTTEHAGTRIYTWSSNHEPVSFDGIGFRRISDLGDIDAIGSLRKSSLTSPRAKSAYVMDNDQFHNESKVLPIGIQTDEILSLEFFNLKFTPPRFIEIQVPWKEIIDIPSLFTMRDPMRKVVKRRFSLGPKPAPEIEVSRFEKQINVSALNIPLITLRVTYERIDANKISIREIKLIMRKYLLTLHYMGEGIALNTV